MASKKARKNGRIEILTDDILASIFLHVDARDLFKFVLIGCNSLNTRLFTHIKELNVQWDPSKRDFWHGHFIRSFPNLATFRVGDSTSNEGPYLPGIDIHDLPKSLTRLELYIANGFLALLSSPSVDPQVFCASAKPLDLPNMFPHLQHLHFLNNYTLDNGPNFDLTSVLAPLPLLTLTISPIRLQDICNLPSTLTELKAIPARYIWDSDFRKLRLAQDALGAAPTATPAREAQDLDASTSTSEALLDKPHLLPNLTKLDLLQLDQLHPLLLPELPRSLKHLRLEFDDVACLQRPGEVFSLSILPPHLISFNLRHISALLLATDFPGLPKSLTDLRVCVAKVEPPAMNTSMWPTLPRQLKVLHLFTISIDPLLWRDHVLEELPRSLVDFATSESTMRLCISRRRADGSYIPTSIEYERLYELPSTLRRIVSRPPRSDLLPSEILEPGMREMSALACDPIADYSDRLAGCSRVRLVQTNFKDFSSCSPALMSLLKTMRLKSFEGSYLKMHAMLQQHSAPSTTPGTASSSSIQENALDAPNRDSASPSSPLEEIILYCDSDDTNPPDMAYLRDENRFPNLKTFCFASPSNTHLLTCLPPTLTHLDIVFEQLIPYADFKKLPTSPLVWRAFDLFPLLPRTLIYARLYACLMEAGNVFAFLPPKLETLIIHGMESANKFLPEKVLPFIPVDQLFHLPPAITRLTLPLFGNSGQGLLITSSEEIRSLQAFFALRPQLVHFQFGYDFETETPSNIIFSFRYAPIRFWLQTAFRQSNTAAHWFCPLMPSRSLALAIRDMGERSTRSLVTSTETLKSRPRLPLASSSAASASSSSTTAQKPDSEEIVASSSDPMESGESKPKRAPSFWKQMFSSNTSEKKFKPNKPNSRKPIKVPYSLTEFTVLQEPIYPARDAAHLTATSLEYAIAYKQYHIEKERKACIKKNILYQTYEELLNQRSLPSDP